MASLDPLARREFLNAVMEVVVDEGITVVLSSHIVAELERVCDHLVTLAQGATQLAGSISEIVASHRLLTGPRSDAASVARVHDVIRESHTERQTTLLVRANGHVYDSCWEQHEVDLEEIVLAYLGYQPGNGASTAPALRGGAVVTWVSWRLQRTETLIAVGILALLAALLIPTGIQMANAYHQDGLAACLAINPSKPVLCGNELGDFQQRFQSLTTLANWFTLIPGLIGVLLAAPFIFDLEHGTYRLAWTQSITRGRWLLGKLGLPVVTAVLAAGALILLFTWWRAPNVHINGRLDTGNYDTTGTVVIGYTLFALGPRARARRDLATRGRLAHRRLRRLLRRAHLRRLLAARPPRRTTKGHLQGRPAAELPLQRTRPELRRHNQRPADRERQRRLPRRPRPSRQHPASARPSSTSSTSPKATSGRSNSPKPASSPASPSR